MSSREPDTIPVVHVLYDDSFQLAASPEAWLNELAGPVALLLPGRDRSRCRMLVTLQHGNEPSGFKAVWQLLSERFEPAVDLLLVLASVEAARTPPMFFHRHLPGMRDLNRCYHPPYQDQPGKLAEAVLQLCALYQPEAVVDLHNTSGSGPAFGVSVSSEPELFAQHKQLISFFCQRLIITPLRMGALMEVDLDQSLGLQQRCPVVTVEAGGARDQAADQIAVDGIRRFALAQKLFDHAVTELDVYHHPRRLELVPGSSVAYATGPLPELSGMTLILDSNIESHNFGVTPAGETLGWCSAENWRQLQLATPTEGHRLEDYFELNDQALCTRQPLHLFMVTTRPDIALSDCLFYFVPVNESQIDSSSEGSS